MYIINHLNNKPKDLVSSILCITLCIYSYLSSNRNWCSLVVDVAEIVQCSWIDHWFSCAHINPWSLWFSSGRFAINSVLFLFFHIPLFSCSITTTNALVVTSLKRITTLEDAIEWWLSLRLLLFREDHIRTKCLECRVKGSSLFDSVCPGLVSVQDLAVLPSIFITF